MAKRKLKRDKKSKEHRKKVREWRAPYQAKGLVYRKVAGKYKWVPKKK